MRDKGDPTDEGLDLTDEGLDLTGEERSHGDWTGLVLPVLVLLVVVGVVCVLVFTGVVSPDEEREAPVESPTTVPTIEITP